MRTLGVIGLALLCSSQAYAGSRTTAGVSRAPARVAPAPSARVPMRAPSAAVRGTAISAPSVRSPSATPRTSTRLPTASRVPTVRAPRTSLSAPRTSLSAPRISSDLGRQSFSMPRAGSTTRAPTRLSLPRAALATEAPAPRGPQMYWAVEDADGNVTLEPWEANRVAGQLDLSSMSVVGPGDVDVDQPPEVEGFVVYQRGENGVEARRLETAVVEPTAPDRVVPVVGTSDAPSWHPTPDETVSTSGMGDDVPYAVGSSGLGGPPVGTGALVCPPGAYALGVPTRVDRLGPEPATEAVETSSRNRRASCGPCAPGSPRCTPAIATSTAGLPTRGPTRVREWRSSTT